MSLQLLFLVFFTHLHIKILILFYYQSHIIRSIDIPIIFQYFIIVFYFIHTELKLMDFNLDWIIIWPSGWLSMTIDGMFPKKMFKFISCYYLYQFIIIFKMLWFEKIMDEITKWFSNGVPFCIREGGESDKPNLIWKYFCPCVAVTLYNGNVISWNLYI